MNERIKKLAEQAGFVDFTVHNRIESKEQVLAKFAELIIEDCDRYARSNWEHGHLLGGDLKRLFGFENEIN